MDKIIRHKDLIDLIVDEDVDSSNARGSSCIEYMTQRRDIINKGSCKDMKILSLNKQKWQAAAIRFINNCVIVITLKSTTYRSYFRGLEKTLYLIYLDVCFVNFFLISKLIMHRGERNLKKWVVGCIEGTVAVVSPCHHLLHFVRFKSSEQFKCRHNEQTQELSKFVPYN